MDMHAEPVCRTRDAVNQLNVIYIRFNFIWEQNAHLAHLNYCLSWKWLMIRKGKITINQIYNKQTFLMSRLRPEIYIFKHFVIVLV